MLLVEGFYLLIVLIAIVRIVHDTRSVTKTLAYLLLVIFIPVLGMIFYFSFGINYRKRKIYSKKLKIDESFKADFQKRVVAYHENLTKLDLPVFRENRELISLLSHANVGGSRVLENSEVRILQNGEAFFPVLIEEMRRAKKHIHMQSYIYEDD
ncbi:MAG: cardiolipin synthase, partial [Sorangiineae bacterium NIC37A_2]